MSSTYPQNRNVQNSQNVELVYNDDVQASDVVPNNQVKLQNDLKDILKKIEGVRRCRSINYFFRN